MNLNVGGLSESLKCSYQQFCKQEAEGRDSSRRLLVKLKKFEAKAFDLVAQTQSAQQMRNQFEKTLMQQNPLFWAQLQRNIATDVADFNLECPLPGYSDTKHTRKMAVNTSCNSSTSEPHSLHEEGVWPHSPSPITDMDLQQLSHGNARHTKMFSSTPHHKDNKEHQNMKKDRKITISNSMPTHKEHIPSPQGNDKTKHSSTSMLDIHHPTENILTPQQVNQCVSANNAILNAKIKDETFDVLPSTANTTMEPVNEELHGPILGHHLIQKPDQIEILSQLSITEIKHPSPGMTEVLVTDPITCKSQDTNKDKDNGIKELQSNITAVDEVTMPVIAPPSPNKIKPFRLNSDSDCGDDPISGPLSGKNVGDDDSDSFWN